MVMIWVAIATAGAFSVVEPPLRQPHLRHKPLAARVTDVDFPLRKVGVFALWAGLISYVAVGAPGKDAASQALDSELLNKFIANPFDPSVSQLFVVEFNYMGLWPAIYASLLLPDSKRQNLPIAPFLIGSVFFGMFAISPYIALRDDDVDNVEPQTGLIGRWFESKANAALLTVGAVALATYGASAIAADPTDALAAFIVLFRSSLFVHVTSLDFCSLWLLSFGVIQADLRARPGADPRLAYLSFIPVYGPLAYLLLRPQLQEP